MRRRILKIFVVLCTTLSIPFAVAMVLSCWCFIDLEFGRGNVISLNAQLSGLMASWRRTYELVDYQGELPETFETASTGRFLNPQWKFDGSITPYGGWMGMRGVKWFDYEYENAPDCNFSTFTSWSITYRLTCPLWLPSIVLNLPAIGLIFHSLRNRVRSKMNQCSKCGYDLRASKEICPECGTRFA